jgi:hypothetical protein
MMKTFADGWRLPVWILAQTGRNQGLGSRLNPT